MDPLKMYFLLKNGNNPASYVSLPEGKSFSQSCDSVTRSNLTFAYFSDGWFNHQLSNLSGSLYEEHPKGFVFLRNREVTVTPSQGNDAVEVGIVPVSEVEENWTTILGVVNWGGKGPSFLKKDIYSIFKSGS